MASKDGNWLIVYTRGCRNRAHIFTAWKLFYAHYGLRAVHTPYDNSFAFQKWINSSCFHHVHYRKQFM